MSTEEQRKLKMSVLLELDEQKTLVAHLKVRHQQTREALSELRRVFDFESFTVALEGEHLKLNERLFPAELVTLEKLVANRREYIDGQNRLAQLQEQARSIGLSLT